MADLNKERIATLTKVAGSSPQLQTPTSSLGGDLVNAAKFGLELYGKNQAQGELAELTRQQTAFQSKVSKGVSEFEKLQREIDASDISSVRANNKINSFLSQFSPEESNAILGGTKALTGRSTVGSIDDAEKEALAIQSAKFELQTKAASLVPFSTLPVPDIETASDSELRSYVINATANKAKMEQDVADMEANRTRATNDNAYNLKVGGYEYRTYALNNIVSQAMQMVKSVDLKDEKQRTQVKELIRNMKETLPFQFETYMKKNYNTVVGPSQVTEAMLPVTSMLNTLESDLLGTDAVTIGDNTRTFITQGIVMSAYRKDPEAVVPFFLGRELKQDIKGHVENAFVNILRANEDSPNKNLDTIEEELRQDLAEKGITGKDQDNVVSTVRDMQLTASKSRKVLNSGEKTVLTKSLLQDINPSTEEDLVRSMQSGTIISRIKELADTKAAETYSGSADEIGRALKRSSDMLIRTTGSKFFTARTQGFASAMSGRRPEESLSSKYVYDPAKAQFILRNAASPAVENVKVIRGLNEVFRNTIKAYENLGLFDQAEALKLELQQQFGDKDASKKEG
jgi:hypothetical protein